MPTVAIVKFYNIGPVKYVNCQEIMCLEIESIVIVVLDTRILPAAVDLHVHLLTIMMSNLWMSVYSVQIQLRI